MAGKATLFMIIGFTLLFMIAIKNFGRISTDSVGNLVEYYNEMISHNIAVSGVNLAANQIFLDNNWSAGYPDKNFSGGKYNVSVQTIDAYLNIKQIISVGTYNGTTSTIKVTFAPSKFSKFAYYSVSEGGTIWWTGKDTVWGPFHTQDYLRSANHPVFFGKATSLKKIIYYDYKSKDKPYFLDGYEQGVSVEMPTDAVDNMETAADLGGLKFENKDTVYLYFVSDSLKYKYSYAAPYTTVYLPDESPNGMIFAKNAIVRLKGTVKGQYTVACNNTTSGRGTIYLDDDIVYNKDPKQYQNSTDMLGICAENSVLITNNTANNSDIDIQASIYAEKGGFGADYYDTRPVSGNINLTGGVIQNTRKAVGTFSGTTTTHGFSKRYKYDNRFMSASPPFFPGTGKFEIVSWLE